MVDYDELLEALVGGATEDVVEIFSQLSHSNLCSIVAQLVLQLAVYYGHPSLVEIAIKYKVCVCARVHLCVCVVSMCGTV